MAEKEKNTWTEWSMHVLAELERSHKNDEAIKQELTEIKDKINQLSIVRSDVNDLKDWKVRMEDAATPSQLKQKLQDVEDLKTFKTQAVTLYLVVQAITAIAIAMIGVFYK